MSTLFSPLAIANGRIQLRHRVVMAPMTRNRGLLFEQTKETAGDVWLADDVVAQYYIQRASPGGLLITEGIPPSLEASGMPQVPGLFDDAQHAGWKAVVDAVHARGGFVYAQLWHAGRATIPHFTGGPGTHVSASSVPWDDPEATYPFRTRDAKKEKVKYSDFPSTAMTDAHIAQTTADFVRAARTALALGFDGVEINGGNGNLLDQFLHSNLNLREDAYGGSLMKRCKFPLDLIGAVVEAAAGAGNVGVRLEPAGLYQGTRGDERVETWSYLCDQLAERYGKAAPGETLSYVHFIEPRFDRIDADAATAAAFRTSWSSTQPGLPISNEPFRAILAAAGIPCIVCGGGWTSSQDVESTTLSSRKWDAVAFARMFVSNPDLPERLRLGKPLAAVDRSRLYGSWDGVREHGYVDYPTWVEEEEAKAKQETG
ncbi:12-oxophytodienoate reductase [Sporothrix brasiliensis 5110]|uniref:12-oxophytodienoate reductase n=1 Tax=Sporothrix brasiliensis 5110 TaxID=1398154 RepID=A0A0C2IDH8_9PEZI|nr:12-oxophytodienoate reductase [Sporothrix brasiliensis 5110]KIH87336.1 12-oxophytodienoate reductase [Sporothrix brasiliensis 5110]